MTQAALSFDAVEYRYEGRPMRFDLDVRPGEWLAVIGPSGAGKSTLLDLAAGFLRPGAGTIRVDGRDVTRLQPAERPLSFVFQENNLFSHLDAFRNVALGVAPDLKLDAGARARVGEALEAVGLAGLEGRRPAEMSGGERQRVALARAFLRERPLLLLDEPFAALGPALRREMMELLDGLRERRGARRLTIVMVTHHPDDARAKADRTAFLDEGRIAALGPTGEILSSRSDTVAAYLGE